MILISRDLLVVGGLFVALVIYLLVQLVLRFDAVSLIEAIRLAGRRTLTDYANPRHRSNRIAPRVKSRSRSHRRTS